MTKIFERPGEDMYAQAHGALLHAAIVFGPVLAEAETGIVVILDISGLSSVNARHGVSVGNQLLQAIATSLRATLGGTGAVARLAGDQFLVVVPGMSSVERVSDSVCEAVLQASVRGRWGRPVRVRTHIGTATWNEECHPYAALVAAGEALSKTNPLPQRR